MEWLNEPETWEFSNRKLTMEVTPQTDYWRVTHYGFTVDNGPFYYSQQGGEFEVTVKISAEYKNRFDQMGLMFRIDEENWIKTGIEYADGTYSYSTVITNKHSSWNRIELGEKPKFVWIKALRRGDAVEIFYSLDGVKYVMSNLAHFPEKRNAMVGMMGASPDGNGFRATFENFKITHLPDERRLKWLEKNNQ